MSDAPSEPVATASQRRFSSNIRWQFIANGSQALLGGLYLVTLGRFLGPAEFGVFSAVCAVVSVVGLLLELRLQEVVARDFCRLDEPRAGASAGAAHLLDLFVLEFFSRAVSMASLFVLSTLISSIANLSPGSSGLIAIAALAFLVGKSGSSVSNGLLRVLGRTDLIAACVALDWGIRLTLTVALGLAAYLDVASALWVTVLVGGLCNAAQILLAWREFSHRFEVIGWSGWRPREAAVRMRGSVRLIASNLGVSCSDLMAKDLDVVMISGMLDPTKVGLYKMAKSFVQVLWRAIDPFYLAIMPEVQRLWQQGQWSVLAMLLRRTSLRLLGLSVVLVVAGYALLALFGERMLGSAYSDVPTLMLTMSVWVVICAPLIWGIPLAVAINRPELSVGGSLLGLLVGLVAFVGLTPSMGLLGCAIAWNLTLIAGFAFTTGLATRIAILKVDRQRA